MIVGAQYQLNKRYQLRTEAGIVGNRKQFLLPLKLPIPYLEKKEAALQQPLSKNK